MKKILTITVIASVVLLFENNCQAQTGNAGTSILRHIVIITFKPGASADSIKALDDTYMGLSKNTMVKDFEMGINISTRDTSVIKHIYATSFASKEDMDSYRKIPEYPKLFKISLSIADDVTVADYWVNK